MACAASNHPVRSLTAVQSRDTVSKANQSAPDKLFAANRGCVRCSAKSLISSRNYNLQLLATAFRGNLLAGLAAKAICLGQRRTLGCIVGGDQWVIG